MSVSPWTLIDSAAMPGDGGEMQLLRRGTEFSIKLGRDQLMNSRVHGSEDALATLACAKIQGRDEARILIGGLGMGFTLRAALGALGLGARIVVAELVPAVVAWNRGPLADVLGSSVSDPRVEVCEMDVAHVIRSAQSAFDAILLDVDNGPEGLTRADNDCLYDAAGLRAAHSALRPGGILGVWSAAPDEKFARRLGAAGLNVETIRVRANGARGGARHTIWLASR